MLCLIRPPNGITERAREVLALLCNPNPGTQCVLSLSLARAHTHTRLPTLPSSISLSMFLPQFACVHTDTGLAPVFDWLSVSGVGRELQAAARRLGDLRSDFKLYLGMDRSIYLRGVAAIMHGLTVSVAGKLTRYCREKLLPFSAFVPPPPPPLVGRMSLIRIFGREFSGKFYSRDARASVESFDDIEESLLRDIRGIVTLSRFFSFLP